MPTALRLGSGALALLALASLDDPPPAPQNGVAIEGSSRPGLLQQDPRDWLPPDEMLRFGVEVTLGPVRGLDVGSVTMRSVLVPDTGESAVEASAESGDSRRLIGTIETLAKGGYLGYEVVHSYAVRWYVGNRPRIEQVEKLRGSRTRTHELRLGEGGGRWQLEYRRDRHCKGCDDRAHFVKGAMPWSGRKHCKDCERPEHHVWKPYQYLDVPCDAVDILSALYLARGFLRSEASEATLHLVNQDELWAVRLARGETREIETEAGTFDCVRVLIGPQLAAGDALGEQANKRFEALFGLHGNMSVWVDRKGAFPVRIEGSAPFGPFDVAIKATLTQRQGR